MRKSTSLNLAVGALGLLAVSSFADVKVSDQLSLSGFVDMSVYGAAPDVGKGSLDASTDQFELDFMFKFSDKLSTRVDVAQGGVGNGGGALTLEQAYISYAMGAATLTTGRFLSSTGYEAAEPTGMFQYSYSVYCDNTNQAVPCLYGGYQNGIGLSYTISPMISVYGAVMGSAAGSSATGFQGATAVAGSTSLKDPAVEVNVAVTPVSGVTVKAFYLYDDLGTYAYNLAEVWGQYAMGPLTAAAEFNYFMNFTAEDDNGTAWLAMVNYKLSDVVAVTGRVSGIASDLGEDETGFTLSPSYTLAPNWLVLAEVSYLNEAKLLTGAVETTITF